jgi:hypothetical protein
MVVKGLIGQGCTFDYRLSIKSRVSECVEYQRLRAGCSYWFWSLELLAAVLLARLCIKSTLVFNIAINPSCGQIPALCLHGSKYRISSERRLLATGLLPSKKIHLLQQLGDVPSQFSAVGLIHLILSIFFATATCQCTIISTRYVPFIFMPESSGVSRFLSVLGEEGWGAFTMAANS